VVDHVILPAVGYRPDAGAATTPAPTRAPKGPKKGSVS